MVPAGADKILDAVLDVAGERGWTRLSIDMVAARAGVPVSDVTGLYPDKRAILNGLADRFEQTADAAVDEDARDLSLPVPERLFDAIMTRLELLQEHRRGYAAIFGAARLDPGMALTSIVRLHSAMSSLLRQTGLADRGPLGCLRRKVLAGLYISVIQVWTKDESEDLGPTMAALDRRLRQLDEIVASTPMGRKSPRKECRFSGL